MTFTIFSTLIYLILLLGNSSAIIGGTESADHPFFVQLVIIDSDLKPKICGATIVDQYWVISAGRCVKTSIHHFKIFIESGDFSNASSSREIVQIDKWYHAIGYSGWDIRGEPMNDLVLIKTKTSFSPDRILRFCGDYLPKDTLLGCCGMGSTSNYVDSNFPDVLMEAYFYETPFEQVSLNQCRFDNICTFGASETSSICAGDHGAPLYAVYCGTRVPECLYGVASYTKDDPMQPADFRCNSGSYFARISDHLQWIREMIEYS